jgi:hypothetical protein
MGQAEPPPRRAITPQLAMAAAAAPPEGIVLDSASRPQARRDAAYRSTPEAAMFRAISGG